MTLLYLLLLPMLSGIGMLGLGPALMAGRAGAAHVVLLLSGLATGVTMDLAMGAAGVNTIATLLIAFARPTLLGLLYSRDDIREGGIPSTGRLGNRAFLNYLIVLVLVHHAVFFSLEALSWAHIVRTIVRTVASGAVSVAFIWVIARIFTAKLPVRI